MLSAILNASGYEAMLRTEGSQERLDNLAELKQSVHDFETTCGEEATLFSYLSHVAMFTNLDAEDRADAVKLMTVHAAKGLEFKNVFLCGMNEGVFPSRKTRDLKGMEEERRLAFVAMTRAEQRLFLSGAEGWNLDGSPRYPSRFVLDIDPGLLEFTHVPGDTLIKNARAFIAANEKYLPQDAQEARFPAGTRIRHSILGEGEILENDPEKGAYLIRFDGVSTPRVISYKVKLLKVES